MGESRVVVLRMQNREALFLPEIEDLFKRSLEKHSDMDHVDVWSWVGAYLPVPEVGVFLARIEDRWCGLAIVSAITDVWSPDPSVLFLYAGAPGVFRGLMDQIREFCDPYSSKFRFVNGTKHDSASYLRLLRPWATGAGARALIECQWQEVPA